MRKPFPLIFLLFLFLLASLYVIYLSKGYVLINDYWTLKIAADLLSFSNPESWFNGYFPIGYILFLKVFGLTIQSAFLFTLLCSIILLYIVFQLAKLVFNSETAALMALGFTFLFPEYSKYLTAPGPYIAFDLLILSSIYFFLKHFRDQEQSRYIFLSGVFIGAAYIFRYHAFVFLPGLIACIFLFGKKKLNLLLFFTFGVFLLVQFQLYIDLLAGKSIFTNFQSISLSRINWYQFNPSDHSVSIFNKIFSNLPDSLIFYVKNFFSRMYVLIPFALVFYFDKKSRSNMLLQMLLIISFLYFLVINFHFSDRGIITLIPVYSILIASFIHFSIRKILHYSNLRITNYICYTLLAVPIGVFVFSNYNFYKKSSIIAEKFIKVEDVIAVDSKNHYYSNEVFTTSFDLYFRKEPFWLMKNGGWLRGSPDFYHSYFPNLSVSDLSSFVSDVRSKNIKYLVMDTNSKKVAGFLYNLYENEENPDFILLAKIDEFKIFKLQE
jgi:4-amino-4-deoxy-L-arabinose transferase-like glycosyltransferase